MRFVDEARLHVIAGHGGCGIVAYRREAHVPRGGPTGGNGGDGGDVIFVASARHPTLLEIKNQRTYRARNGGAGGPNNRTGANGENLILEVPVGTLVYDDDTGELLVDMVEDGQREVIVRGGKGGKGNAHFKTAIRRTPDFAQDGLSGEELRVRLELKVLADVGLVGFPNAGKSSLIRSISASRAEVADYPFTTVVPNLGVVASGKLGSFVVADIPGLIEGAHEGAGLGHRFLRHVERTRLFVHVLSASPDRDPEADYAAIHHELAMYDEALAERRQIVVLNKIDLHPHGEREALIDRVRRFATGLGQAFAATSCLTGEGIQSFRRLLEDEVCEATPKPDAEPYDPLAF
jgi:GTP-binding protein